jgi:predicted SAM-dependent methyltransferase
MMLSGGPRRSLGAFRSRLRQLTHQLRARRRLRQAVARAGGDVRVIIGASGTAAPGWIPSEYPIVDVADVRTLRPYFRDASVRAFLAEHVWEHLAPAEAARAAENCYRLLVPGGYLRIAVPDGLHPDPAYIEYVRPGGSGAGSDDHKVLYTHRSLSALLQQAGFQVRLLEWFDERGQFHLSDWDPAAGPVSRSSRFDERNVRNPTAYTSLIADAVRPGPR